MISIQKIRDQLNYLIPTYMPKYKIKSETRDNPGENVVDSWISGIEQTLAWGGKLDLAYKNMLSHMLDLISFESHKINGGENHFPNTPVNEAVEFTHIWLPKLVPADLVNAFYGPNIPTATYTTLVRQIETSALDRTDFTAAFLTAKINDGIAMPTVEDILIRADALNLTPHTLQFDDDHILTHIYLGAFGRAPDGDGLAYWKAKVDEIGIKPTVEAMYQGGLANGELSASVSNVAFVTAFYHAILGRAPDDTGLPFWAGKLDAGHLDRGFAIHAFVEGTSNGRDAKFVNNKALVAQAFADATVGKAATPALLKAAKDVLANVHERDYSARDALDAIADGSIFKTSTSTPKTANFDWLDAHLLFNPDEADEPHADTQNTSDNAGVELLGVSTAHPSELIG